MILNPRFLEWLSDEKDQYGNRKKLKDNTPEDIKKEYEAILKEEEKSIRKNKFKSTII